MIKELEAVIYENICPSLDWFFVPCQYTIIDVCRKQLYILRVTHIFATVRRNACIPKINALRSKPNMSLQEQVNDLRDRRTVNWIDESRS